MARRSLAWPAGRGAIASTSRWSRLGRPGRGLGGCCGFPRCRCRTTSTRGCSARSRSAPRAGCSLRTRSPSRPCAAPGPRRGSCSAIPGSRRTTTWPTSSRTRAVLDELGDRPRRVLVVVRPPPETSAYHAATRLYEAAPRPPRRRSGRSSPSSSREPRLRPRRDRGRSAGRAEPPRPRPRDRRPEPDRLRRPGGQRRRHDESRGGRPRNPRLHDLQRSDGGGRRAPDRDRSPAGAGRSRQLGAAQAGRRAGRADPRDPQLLVDGSSRPSGSLAAGGAQMPALAPTSDEEL